MSKPKLKTAKTYTLYVSNPDNTEAPALKIDTWVCKYAANAEFEYLKEQGCDARLDEAESLLVTTRNGTFMLGDKVKHSSKHTRKYHQRQAEKSAAEHEAARSKLTPHEREILGVI